MKMRMKKKDNTAIQKNVQKIHESLSYMASLSAHEVYTHLNTRQYGLSDGEVEERYEEYGKNEVAHEKARTWYM